MNDRRYKQDILFWIIFLIAGSLLSFHMMHRDISKGFGSLAYGSVPYFQFDNQLGETITLHKIKGKVCLMHFISDGREGPSSHAVDKVKKIHRSYGNQDNFRLITISSNVSKVNQMKSLVGMDQPVNWHFLNGSTQQVNQFMKDGFLMDYQRDAFAMNDRIFLIDQNATIRGFYTLSETDVLVQMEAHLSSLL